MIFLLFRKLMLKLSANTSYKGNWFLAYKFEAVSGKLFISILSPIIFIPSTEFFACLKILSFLGLVLNHKQLKGFLLNPPLVLFYSQLYRRIFCSHYSKSFFILFCHFFAYPPAV